MATSSSDVKQIPLKCVYFSNFRWGPSIHYNDHELNEYLNNFCIFVACEIIARNIVLHIIKGPSQIHVFRATSLACLRVQVRPRYGHGDWQDWQKGAF